MLLCVLICLLYGTSVFSLDLPPIYAKILDELSWTLKLKLLKDFTGASSTTTTTTLKPARRVGMEALIMADPEISGNSLKTKVKSIYINNALAEKDPSEYLRDSPRFSDINDRYGFDDAVNNQIKLQDTRRYNKNKHFIRSRKSPKLYRNEFNSRKFLNSSNMGRRQEGTPPATTTEGGDDESNMRMKLFRLMYETVRDSDLKVKRAELIKTHYYNSSAFDIGFLMGDITDKNNIMHDIASTLERLYHEWKPIEHINAYEQIANQAIEISHLIDMVRHINKRVNTTTE